MKYLKNSIQLFFFIFGGLMDNLIAKDKSYRIYIIQLGSYEYTSIQFKSNRYFKYFMNSKYLIDMEYCGSWYSIEIETKDDSPRDFIKRFHTSICIELRKQLIRRGIQGDVNFKKIPIRLSYIFQS